MIIPAPVFDWLSDGISLLVGFIGGWVTRHLRQPKA